QPLLEFLNRTDIVGEKIEVLQLVSRMVKELKSSINERGHSGLRKVEPDEDSPGSSEHSSGSTLLPKSTGTGDNLESSLNQDIGTETKAKQFEVKKEVCESVKGEECIKNESYTILSTGKVEQGKIIPFCN
ncbi:myb transcription factor, partial [Trifolium medium]|nr:myb transcription factor [Trifolium medium]